MRFTNTLGTIAFVLVIIGAINWFLIGVFNYNLVADLFGAGDLLTEIIYTLVGIAGIYLAIDAVTESSMHERRTTATS